MADDPERIGPLSRFAAAALGGFILLALGAFAVLMLRRHWYAAAVFGMFGAIGGSAVFIKAAIRGESPPWSDAGLD